MKQVLRDYLVESGLFLEGTELVGINEPLNVYAGINVTKTNNEPIDQLQVFIAAKRIQEWNIQQFGKPGLFIPFIAGLYEVLNAANQDEMMAIVALNSKKEEQKKLLYKRLIQQFNINAKIVTTKDVWDDGVYWDILLSILNTGDFTRGLLIQDTLAFYETTEQLFATLRMKQLPSNLVKLPVPFLKQIGNWPAPLLYTPCEVAEALYFQKTANVQCKIGQAQERVYDKYLVNRLTVIRLRQPVDLFSTAQKPYTVTPYIDKEKEKESSRIFFGDSKNSLQQKISVIQPESTVFTTDREFGEVLNPIAEKAIFAIEAARAQGKTPTTIDTIIVSSGQELIYSLLRGDISVASLQQALQDLLTKYIFLNWRTI